MTTPAWPFPSLADPEWLTPPGTPDPYLAACRDAVRDLAPPTGPEQLTGAITAARELAERIDWVLLSLVGEARGAGMSWEAVAGALGVSKQAAHKRFSPYVALAVEQATAVSQVPEPRQGNEAPAPRAPRPPDEQPDSARSGERAATS